MGTVSHILQEPEEARERYFWGAILRVLGTLAILLLVLGILASLTALLGWRRYLLLSGVGLLAGAFLSLPISGAARSRELVSLALGALTLPLLAAHLAGIAARGDEVLGSYSASFIPFLAHASGAVLCGVVIARLWSGRPPAPRPESGADAGLDGEGAPP